jgi:hypothetical protein
MPSQLRWLRSAAPAATLGLLLACESSHPFEPPLGAVEFDPPEVYTTWWADVEACAQTRADFTRVRWFMVPGDSFICHPFRCAALWSPDHHIYVAEAHRRNKRTVQHEMLHDIVDDGDHDHAAWGACGF